LYSGPARTHLPKWGGEEAKEIRPQRPPHSFRERRELACFRTARSAIATRLDNGSQKRFNFWLVLTVYALFWSDAIDDPKFHVFETVILCEKRFELRNEIGVRSRP
jgi:hypothetical protein